MSKPVNADRFLTKRWPYGSTEVVYYVRPGGSDDNDGLTALTAFATLSRALHFMAIAEVNVPVAIDITGMTITEAEVLNIGGTSLGGLSFDIDLGATSPNNFFSRKHRQIRSELSLVSALNVTGQAFDAVSGILTLTVTNALVANALRGAFAVGSVLGEYGTIRSNTGGAGPNTIEVCNLVGLTGPVNVYTTGATIEYGDAGNFFEQCVYLLAMADWNLQGIRFNKPGAKATALSIWPNATVNLTLCEIEGLEVNAGGGHVYIDGCYIHDGTFSQDGATVSATQSYFRTISFLCHGSGATGLNEWIGCCVDASTAFGGGNLESAYAFQFESGEIDSGTGYGVSALFGVSTLRDVVISNCASGAVNVTGPTLLYMDNVQGTGNTGYGVRATYKAAVVPSNGTAVTGTTNDLFVGSIGAATWAAAPLTDLDQLVRVGA